MPSAESGPGVTDSHGVGAAASQLGGGSRRAGRVAFMVMSNVLKPGERVEALAQGRYLGADAALAVTSDRVLLVNSREWDPDFESIQLAPGLTVQGWQDQRTACLVLTHAGGSAVFDRISDLAAAKAVADLVRSRVG